jgi:molecular chaperone HscC
MMLRLGNLSIGQHIIVGIDLGTTNSLVAVWENGAARLLPNSLGQALTPSCVSVDDDGAILVFRSAASSAITRCPTVSARW